MEGQQVSLRNVSDWFLVVIKWSDAFSLMGGELDNLVLRAVHCQRVPKVDLSSIFAAQGWHSDFILIH